MANVLTAFRNLNIYRHATTGDTSAGRRKRIAPYLLVFVSLVGLAFFAQGLRSARLAVPAADGGQCQQGPAALPHNNGSGCQADVPVASAGDQAGASPSIFAPAAYNIAVANPEGVRIKTIVNR